MAASVLLQFNDRGRGPNITEHIVLDSQGIPAHLENTGIDYDKARVNEQFSSHQRQRCLEESCRTGRQPISAKAFYVSISGAPEESALLARALLSRRPAPPDRRARPRIEKRGELKSRPTASRTVTQYAIAGLDFTPTPIWLNQDGAFFATVSAWFSSFVEGCEHCRRTSPGAGSDNEPALRESGKRAGAETGRISGRRARKPINTESAPFIPTARW